MKPGFFQKVDNLRRWTIKMENNTKESRSVRPITMYFYLLKKEL